jgi:hypothetical protein
MMNQTLFEDIYQLHITGLKVAYFIKLKQNLNNLLIINNLNLVTNPPIL